MSRAARVGVVIALIGWALIAIAVWSVWPVLAQLADPARSRTFYIPSESMLPTLMVNDRVRPRAAGAADLLPGSVIVFEGPDTVRVARIVATGGQTVALRAGAVLIDGVPATLHDVGPGPIVERLRTRLGVERLPGEQHSHRVLDLGDSVVDDFGPLRIPPDHLFVLGDNRDRAADSRFSPAVGGVGLVRPDQVIGVADRLLWRSGFRDLGKPID